jgi:hypothetical protein
VRSCVRTHPSLQTFRERLVGGHRTGRDRGRGEIEGIVVEVRVVREKSLELGALGPVEPL